MNAKSKESEIQKGILDYLNLVGVAVKTGTFATQLRDSNGNTRFVQSNGGYNNGRGWVDIVFCYKGKVYLIEVKRPGEKLNENQVVMHNALHRKGGVEVHVMTSVDDAASLRRMIDDNEHY